MRILQKLPHALRTVASTVTALEKLGPSGDDAVRLRVMLLPGEEIRLWVLLLREVSSILGFWLGAGLGDLGVAHCRSWIVQVPWTAGQSYQKDTGLDNPCGFGAKFCDTATKWCALSSPPIFSMIFCNNLCRWHCTLLWSSEELHLRNGKSERTLRKYGSQSPHCLTVQVRNLSSQMRWCA